MPATPDEPRAPRGLFSLALWVIFGTIIFAGFVALGTWQVHRRAWKLDLLERIDTRIHAPVIAAPASSQWPHVTAAGDEYRHVSASGSYLYDKQVLVWTSSDLGSGYWVMTPLRADDGSIIMVNRGFVLADSCKEAASCAPGATGSVTVTGLLRMPELKGFLRHNDLVADRWYTRDVAAMASARKLPPVAPYFIDADAPAGPQPDHSWPRAGLTVVSFPNNHLQYAITWYVLALLTVVGVSYVVRDGLRSRQHAAD
ncbi:SURF1 family protein [Dyella sp.]|uniref:SURF1 family protein n=1 Tax=Dyella sp. TaxID=1869338 RepID=UPI002ED6970A